MRSFCHEGYVAVTTIVCPFRSANLCKYPLRGTLENKWQIDGETRYSPLVVLVFAFAKRVGVSIHQDCGSKMIITLSGL